MPSPRSKRLAGPTNLQTDGQRVLIYTVPAEKVALVKSIRVVNRGSTVTAFELTMASAPPTNPLCVASLAAGAQFVDPDTDPIVLVAGETLYAMGDVGSGSPALTVTLSGAELSA